MREVGFMRKFYFSKIIGSYLLNPWSNKKFSKSAASLLSTEQLSTLPRKYLGNSKRNLPYWKFNFLFKPNDSLDCNNYNMNQIDSIHSYRDSRNKRKYSNQQWNWHNGMRKMWKVQRKNQELQWNRIKRDLLDQID